MTSMCVSLRVLVGGMEVQLPKHRTTNRYVENMSEMFCLNDVVKVRIVRLTKKPNGDPEVVLDAREHERNEMAVNLSKIREEGSYRGILTRINFNQRTNRPLFHPHLIDYDVVAVAVGAPNQFGSVPCDPHQYGSWLRDWTYYPLCRRGGSTLWLGTRITRKCI